MLLWENAKWLLYRGAADPEVDPEVAVLDRLIGAAFELYRVLDA